MKNTKANKINSIELTEKQKRLLTDVLLNIMQGYDITITKYGFHSSITKPLKELKEEVYAIFQIINSSIKEDEEEQGQK